MIQLTVKSEDTVVEAVLKAVRAAGDWSEQTRALDAALGWLYAARSSYKYADPTGLQPDRIRLQIDDVPLPPS